MPATFTNLLPSLEATANLGDNYAERIRGYLHPQQTGAYTFWIASDNASELYLSTNEQPENKARMAYLNEPVYGREWNRYETQQSVLVQLEAGKKYYLEVLHKEGYAEDNLAVGWRTPLTANMPPEVIPGAVLSPYVSPASNAQVTRARVAITDKVATPEKGSLQFQVYPNPTSEIATVAFTAQESGWLKVQVFDLQGRLNQQLFSEEVKAGSFHQKQLDVSAFSPGLYLLRMVNGNKIQHLKLLVTH